MVILTLISNGMNDLKAIRDLKLFSGCYHNYEITKRAFDELSTNLRGPSRLYYIVG